MGKELNEADLTKIIFKCLEDAQSSHDVFEFSATTVAKEIMKVFGKEKPMDDSDNCLKEISLTMDSLGFDLVSPIHPHGLNGLGAVAVFNHREDGDLVKVAVDPISSSTPQGFLPGFNLRYKQGLV